jgi:hypothetical protein
LHAATLVILTQKSILNLSVDPMEPLLGPVGSFLTSGKLRFQLRDPIFGRVQLMRKLLSHVERTLAVFFGNASRSVEQLKNRLTRLVELIGPSRRVATGSPRITRDLTMHRSALSTESGYILSCGGVRLWHDQSVVRVPLSFAWMCDQ